jgi:hypothetical protein
MYMKDSTKSFPLHKQHKNKVSIIVIDLWTYTAPFCNDF